MGIVLQIEHELPARGRPIGKYVARRVKPIVRSRLEAAMQNVKQALESV